MLKCQQLPSWAWKMFYNLWARVKIQVSDPGSWYASCLIAIAKKLGEKNLHEVIANWRKNLIVLFLVTTFLWLDPNKLTARFWWDCIDVHSSEPLLFTYTIMAVLLSHLSNSHQISTLAFAGSNFISAMVFTLNMSYRLMCMYVCTDAWFLRQNGCSRLTLCHFG